MAGLVTLRTGEAVPVNILNTTFVNIRKAAKESRPALRELMEKCKDPAYQFTSAKKVVLQKYSLIQGDESVHSAVKSVAQATIIVSGDKVGLVHPIHWKPSKYSIRSAL